MSQKRKKHMKSRVLVPEDSGRRLAGWRIVKNRECGGEERSLDDGL